jgi:DNA polymerase-3 subunit delta'
MPFPVNWIEERLRYAQQENRLAHAYLLVGHDLDQLRGLFLRLASQLLGSAAEGHPDLHVIQPESKSRRLTVEQIRNLEQQLQLKARQAKTKVAGIVAADRMCVGSAEAANAFLKTLEEPPDNTVIFLLTDRLEQLLPTIRSRCLVLQIEADDNASSLASAESPVWAKDWLNVKGSPADQAYRRAGLLSGHWKKLREQVETQNEEKISNDEEALPALIEAEYLLARDNSIRALIIGAWRHADRLTATLIVNGLEDLRYALSRNIEQNLALERVCLKISGLIEDKF